MNRLRLVRDENGFAQNEGAMKRLMSQWQYPFYLVEREQKEVKGVGQWVEVTIGKLVGWRIEWFYGVKAWDDGTGLWVEGQWFVD